MHRRPFEKRKGKEFRFGCFVWIMAVAQGIYKI